MVVKLLLERGVNADVHDTNGRSTLELARMQGHKSCINTLEANDTIIGPSV